MATYAEMLGECATRHSLRLAAKRFCAALVSCVWSLAPTGPCTISSWWIVSGVVTGLLVPLIDEWIAPEFHLIVQGGSNGEVYNMVIRGMSRFQSTTHY